MQPVLFNAFIIELAKGWRLLVLCGNIPTPEVWLLGWGLVPGMPPGAGGALQSAVEGVQPGPALAIGSCVSCAKALPCTGDPGSCTGSTVAVEKPGDGPSPALLALQVMQRWFQPVGLCRPHCHPWGQSNSCGKYGPGCSSPEKALGS